MDPFKIKQKVVKNRNDYAGRQAGKAKVAASRERETTRKEKNSEETCKERKGLGSIVPPFKSPDL